MVYRGDDLDLRIPHELHAGSHEAQLKSFRARGASGAERLGPIWVDETLLECCNNAYGVALAHRHAEVQIEHLVFAFTSVPAAARSLEDRGTRLAALRHETGSLIATEIPPKKSNGSIEPRRADAFEDLLRIAAGSAYRFKSTVGVEDVINVILDFRHDIPGVHRIRSLIGHAGLSGYDSDSQSRERAWTPPPTYTAVEPPRQTAAEQHQMVTDTAWQAHTNAGRLEILENSIRGLANELANERSVISGVLHDLQREVKGQRETGVHMTSLGPDKIQGFLAERLSGLEQALVGVRSSSTSEVAAMRDQLAAVERSLAGEMEVIRGALHELATRPISPSGDTSQLAAKLETIEQAVAGNDLVERVQALDIALAAERDRSTGADNYLGSSLDALANTVQTQADEISQPITERINGLAIALENVQQALSTTVAENGTSLANLHNSVGSMQSSLYGLQNSMQAMGGVVDSHIARTATAEQHVAEKLAHLESRHEHVAVAFDNVTAEAAAVSQSMQGVDQTMQALSRDTGHAFAMLSARIDSLEKASERPIQMIEELSSKTDKIHRLMVERYFRRSRFWYWLFGTDDWLAASWPSQNSRIERHLKQFNDE